MAMEAVRDGRWGARPRAPAKARGKAVKRGRLAGLLWGCLLLASVYLIAYTPIHDWFHTLRMQRIIAAYDRAVADLPEEERRAMLEAALAYNRGLAPGTHFQPGASELREYSAQLDVTGTGMMGYLRIPRIHVSLPIYQTASADVLEQAVGHIPGSSLPVGGETCHTVLCGHRDQSTAWLFHDLDRLENGDTFTLTVLDQTVTYAVDQVSIVLPQQIDALAIEEGADYCTLVTCHPHGSSAYRMLVRGKRI